MKAYRNSVAGLIFLMILLFSASSAFSEKRVSLLVFNHRPVQTDQFVIPASFSAMVIRYID